MKSQSNAKRSRVQASVSVLDEHTVERDAFELAVAIRAFWESETERNAVSQTARKFYLRNDAVDKATERFELFFCDAVGVVPS